MPIEYTARHYEALGEYTEYRAQMHTLHERRNKLIRRLCEVLQVVPKTPDKPKPGRNVTSSSTANLGSIGGVVMLVEPERATNPDDGIKDVGEMVAAIRRMNSEIVYLMVKANKVALLCKRDKMSISIEASAME